MCRFGGNARESADPVLKSALETPASKHRPSPFLAKSRPSAAALTGVAVAAVAVVVLMIPERIFLLPITPDRWGRGGSFRLILSFSVFSFLAYLFLPKFCPNVLKF